MNPEAKPGYCSNKGARHIQRARDLGQRVKIGRQRCMTCGARIEVVEKPQGWAFYPVHERP